MSALKGLDGPGRRRAVSPGVGLGRRLGVALAVLGIVALVALAVAGWSFVRQLDARHRVVDRLSPASIQAQILLGAYVNEETGVRGYVLTNERSFLEPYAQGLSEQRSARPKLDSLLVHEATSARLLGIAEQRATQWREQFAAPAIAAVRAGKGTHYSSSSALNRERRGFDGIRAAFAAVNQSLAQARATSVQRLNEADTVFISTLIAGAVLLLVAGLLAWLALRAWVIGPLSLLGENVRRVADGDLRRGIEPIGPPELISLAADADAMRLRILEELAIVDDARRQLSDLNADLARTNADLARSNVELEQFAYVASHDLQEPLRKVASFCQLLQRRYQGQLDARAEEYISFAVDGASRMQTLINDLLAFSRVGRTTERFVAVDLDLVYRQILRTLDSTISDAHATVTADALPTVPGDASLLAALFQNLVTNSVKFRGSATPSIHIGCEARDDHWVLHIVDNGIGIEPRFADRVFVIFQRLHTKDAYPGTGIGLALCKKIVEFHRGEMWLDRDYVGGARIYWTLPMTGPH